MACSLVCVKISVSAPQSQWEPWTQALSCEFALYLWARWVTRCPMWVPATLLISWVWAAITKYQRLDGWYYKRLFPTVREPEVGCRNALVGLVPSSLVKENLFMPQSCSSACKCCSPLSSSLCIDFSVSKSFPASRHPTHTTAFFGCTIRPVGSQFPSQGLNLWLLQWKYEVLTTGQPGRSPNLPPFIGTTVTLG